MGALTLGIKSFQTFIYALLFLSCGTILALYSYFLATQSRNDVPIPNRHKAVEGISGSGVLYSIFAILLTCCLGGKSFFAFIGIVLDVLFAGAFIAVAILTRDGTNNCTSDPVSTPLGEGRPGTQSVIVRNVDVTWSVTLRTACRMEKAAFAVSIIAAGLFIIAALIQLWLGRRHQKDKRFGPSPDNNYTSGSKRKGFTFFRRHKKDTAYPTRNGDHLGGAAPEPATMQPVAENRYSHGTTTTDGLKNDTGAGGYHTAPVGSAVNPYGYENTRSHGTAV